MRGRLELGGSGGSQRGAREHKSSGGSGCAGRRGAATPVEWDVSGAASSLPVQDHASKPLQPEGAE